MAIKNIIGKMFTGAKRTHDEFGQPIQEESMEEKLLKKHLEREHRKKVKKLLAYYEKKHYKEMASIQLPYHKKFKKLNRR